MPPTRTFLVIDDNDDNRFLNRHALQKGFPGARVIECATPEEALAAIASVEIDGVLTDHHLGARDGGDLTRQLREQGLRCPVVMVTASSDPRVHQRAYDAGAARVFAGNDFDFVGYFQTLFATRHPPVVER